MASRGPHLLFVFFTFILVRKYLFLNFVIAKVKKKSPQLLHFQSPGRSSGNGMFFSLALLKLKSLKSRKSYKSRKNCVVFLSKMSYEIKDTPYKDTLSAAG